MRSTDQRLTDTEARLAKLQDRLRKDHARQMILLGAIVFAETRRSAGFRQWLVGKLGTNSKQADQSTIDVLIDRIQRNGVTP